MESLFAESCAQRQLESLNQDLFTFACLRKDLKKPESLCPAFKSLSTIGLLPLDTLSEFKIQLLRSMYWIKLQSSWKSQRRKLERRSILLKMNWSKFNLVKTFLTHLKLKSTESWTKSETKPERLLSALFLETIRLDWWSQQVLKETTTISTRSWPVLDNKTLKVNELLMDSTEELFLTLLKMTTDQKAEALLKILIWKVWLHQNSTSTQWEVEKELSILQSRLLKQDTFKEDLWKLLKTFKWSMMGQSETAMDKSFSSSMEKMEWQLKS